MASEEYPAEERWVSYSSRSMAPDLSVSTASNTRLSPSADRTFFFVVDVVVDFVVVVVVIVFLASSSSSSLPFDLLDRVTNRRDDGDVSNFK